MLTLCSSDSISTLHIFGLKAMMASCLYSSLPHVQPDNTSQDRTCFLPRSPTSATIEIPSASLVLFIMNNEQLELRSEGQRLERRVKACATGRSIRVMRGFIGVIPIRRLAT